MRDDLGSILRDVSLTTLALAIAIGWSLYQLAHGVGTFVDGLFTHLPPGVSGFSTPITGGGLTWVVGHRLVSLDGVFVGGAELALSVAAAVYIGRHRA